MRLVLLLAVAVLASACQVRFATDIVIDADGAGELELAVAADAELVELVTEAGVDLRRGLEEAIAAAPRWEVEDVDTGDGGLELRFRTSFDDPDDLGVIVADLHAALDDEDGALMRDVTLEVGPDGAVSIAGVAGVLLPRTTGAVGPEVGFDGDDLRELLEQRGDDLVRADLRVVLPAEPAAHDADEVDGRALVWSLPVGEMREFSAVSAVPPPDRTPILAAAVFAAGLVIAGLAVLLVRRRGTRRAGRRAERQPTG